MNASFSFANENDEVCGGTFQSFWQIEFNSNSLLLKAFYRHPESRFCEISMTQSPNAEVLILDSSKDIIRKFNTYIPVKTYQDVMANNRLSGSVRSLKSPIIQIKFADDLAFKKAKFIKIVFTDGSIYGPSSL
jgi:hypothetical protein